jgi:hypothetical protein
VWFIKLFFRVIFNLFSLPQSLDLPMEFFVGVCTIISSVINLPTKSPMEMLRR